MISEYDENFKTLISVYDVNIETPIIQMYVVRDPMISVYYGNFKSL